MGHSYGGLLTQLLLDRGLGVAGVAIDSAPPEGIHKVPPAQIKALFPAFENPANRHRAVSLAPKQFHYAFCNTSARRSPTPSTSATTSRRRAASCGTGSCPMSSPATRRRG